MCWFLGFGCVNLCFVLVCGFIRFCIILYWRWYMWQFLEWKMSLPVCMFWFVCWLISVVIASFSSWIPAVLAGGPAYASHDLK